MLHNNYETSKTTGMTVSVSNMYQKWENVRSKKKHIAYNWYWKKNVLATQRMKAPFLIYRIDPKKNKIKIKRC